MIHPKASVDGVVRIIPRVNQCGAGTVVYFYTALSFPIILPTVISPALCVQPKPETFITFITRRVTVLFTKLPDSSPNSRTSLLPIGVEVKSTLGRPGVTAIVASGKRTVVADTLVLAIPFS